MRGIVPVDVVLPSSVTFEELGLETAGGLVNSMLLTAVVTSARGLSKCVPAAIKQLS